MVVADHDTVITGQAFPHTLCTSSVKQDALIRWVVYYTPMAKHRSRREACPAGGTGVATVPYTGHNKSYISHTQHDTLYSSPFPQLDLFKRYVSVLKHANIHVYDTLLVFRPR